MQTKPLRTDADHEAALREIEALWGAQAGTEAGKRLDALVLLVEAYESGRWPISLAEPVQEIEPAVRPGWR